MKHLFNFILTLAAALVLSGCYTRTIIPEEVLQVSAHARIRTAYNIWYVDPEAIDAENIQKGTIIPFGTEVVILSATESKITFRIKEQVFTILYHADRFMMPAEDFLKQLFTTETAADLAAGLTPITYEKLRRGIVEPGMSRKNVIAAYGPPVRTRTPNLLSDTWVYWLDRVKTKRVIFKNDKVLEEIVLE